MDKLKKSRSVLRSSFSRTLNSLNGLLACESTNSIDIQVTYELLSSKAEELQVIDKHIYEALIESEDVSENDILADSEKSDEYSFMFRSVKLKVEKILQTNDAVSVHDSETSLRSNSRKFKLPQIKIKQFDGDLINWLPFWSQFSKIHNDGEIASEDKFQYLLQAVVPGTRAYDLMESYPPIGPNYSKAIDGLKARFGKEDLLVEVYVRELLKIVLTNALGSRNKISLQCLYDKLESHLRALETLGVTTDKCASILYPLVESCMPEDLLRAWQRSPCKTGNEPQERLNNLMKFMLSEVEGEQRIGLAMSGFGINCRNKEIQERRPNHNQQTKTDTPTAASLVSYSKYQSTLSCIFCDKDHKSSDCFTAQKMSYEEKQKVLKEKSCCFCCLKPGHSIKFCKARLKCALCKRRHFVLMCPTLNSKDDKESSKETSKEMTVLEQDVTLTNKSSTSPKVFMQTVVASLRNPKSSDSDPVRILFDTGSQRSYILDNLATKMGYKSLGEETLVHSLFGNVKSAERKHQRYRIYLSSQDKPYKCNFEVLGQPTICGHISQVNSGPWIQELARRNVALTDTLEESMPIGILIGADIAGKLFTGNRIQLPSGLVAMETQIGWTLMGKISGKEVENCVASVVTSMFINEADISELWRLDSIGIREPSEHQTKQQKDLSVKKYFLETTKTDHDGRYEVSLPWVDSHPPLPDNKDLAEKRLHSVVKKLDNNLFTDYDAVFQQWLHDGIIEIVPRDELNNNGHYLPHRPIVKESSTTTRVRPVFDASAKLKLMPSLNECLENGPNLIELIPSVMLRFREGKYAVIADITKAFLQISLNEIDRDFLRFLWFTNENINELIVYRHKRVVFGVKCSPFLLGAVIELHLQKSLERGDFNPDIVCRLQKSFYVDNVSTSLDTPEQLVNFVDCSKVIMANGKFELRGWKSTGCEDVSSCTTANVLGIQWDYQKDVLFVNLDCLNDIDPTHITKRDILSISHRIFDPIGFICPVMICPKLLLQKMWDSKIDWDTAVNDNIAQEFMKWFNELQALKNLNIPRWIGKSVLDETGCSIHTFCDASKDAYGTVIYLKVENDSGVTVQLISAKSRVAPLKKTSIPRLELLAATVGTRLTETILNEMNWKHIPVFYWTDSSTVLAWIKQESNWSVFVWNRVSEIRKLTKPCEWNHIPGEYNPADLPSRGCNASHLLKSKWWEGPEWLMKPNNEWPTTTNVEYCNEEIIEEKVKKKKTTDNSTDLCLINKDNPCCTKLKSKWYSQYFSEYPKIIRLVGWICRFLTNCKTSKNFRSSGELRTDEIDVAERKLLKVIQQEVFSGITDKSLASLVPVLDENGLLRLKTKLCEKEDSFAFRYPIILPAKHPVVKALICYYHKRNCHAGVQLLMNKIREEFWILGGRRSIRAVISKCVICKRHTSKKLETTSGTLPIDRMRESAVFEVTGIDFAGPLYLKKGEKAWICLFTCATYRAVHLELVTSLSTDAFIQALRRFIARRGRPSVVYSDNGTNFVGASNSIKEINWQEIMQYGSTHRIHWKFNPPTAAWWGGWWERLIRILKELLRRVLGRASLTYQEMTTILCDCESVINSRPLTYLYDGISDLSPLTPNHFLQDIRECGVPDLDKIDEVNLNNRLKYLQNLRQNLRNRFRKEYLGQLLHKSKRNTRNDILSVGDVVLVECENLKRINWPMAVVIKLLPDKTGTVRLAKVKTTHAELLRPIQRLYPLEVSTQNSINIQKMKTNFEFQNHQEEVTTRSGRSVKIPTKYTLLC